MFSRDFFLRTRSKQNTFIDWCPSGEEASASIASILGKGKTYQKKEPHRQVDKTFRFFGQGGFVSAPCLSMNNYTGFEPENILKMEKIMKTDQRSNLHGKCNKLVSLPVWILAFVAIGVFAGITQAGTTCLDSLEGKAYSCTIVEAGGNTPASMTFDPAAVGLQLFGTIVVPTEYGDLVGETSCACKAVGKLGNLRFNEHKDKFLCTQQAFEFAGYPIDPLPPPTPVEGKILGDGADVIFEGVGGETGDGFFLVCSEDPS